MSELRHSAIYTGRVRHTRRAPVTHSFEYAMSMLYLDLDELQASTSSRWFGIERLRPLSFRRRDYIGDPSVPLRESVETEVRSALNLEVDGPIRLLTQVRSLGYVFNPVSFYYCFSKAEELRAVVAEITNTPWSERHRYVLAAETSRAESSFPKAFHVSPFFGMKQRYHWRLTSPGSKLGIQMSNEEDGDRVFSASLVMKRKPITAANLRSVFVKAPVMSLGLHAAIYFQALRLWIKRVPFYTHPSKSRQGLRSISDVTDQRTVRGIGEPVPAFVPQRTAGRKEPG